MAGSSDQVALPVDLLHLLSELLSDTGDFPTLYNCVVSSRHFASAGAVAALYRISHSSPVRSGGNEGLPLAEQELNVQKWSILWRSIVLSALGKTLFPYCRHLRVLDLRDLGYLLEDDKFRGKISKNFFSDDLAQFNYTVQMPTRTRIVRLDRDKIVSAFGNEITQHAPLLEILSEPMLVPTLSTGLLTWAPRLTHLRRLELFDGKALANATLRNLLHAHCQNLEALTLFQFTDDSPMERDNALATFINGMPHNKLTYLQVIGDVGVADETCLALNNHGRSLTTLSLRLGGQGILALGLLKECTALVHLAIGADRGYAIDLKATQNDVYLEITKWLETCTELKELEFFNIASAPDLVTPLLLSNKVELEDLSINATWEDNAYVVKDHHDFHRALSGQRSLRSLLLRADPEPPTRDDTDLLLSTFCSLTELRQLKLIRVSDYFNDESIYKLSHSLRKLENLYIGGFGATDGALTGIQYMKDLTQLTFGSLSRFTMDGILELIYDLEETGHTGFILSIESADPEYAISEEDQERLRDLMQTKVDGRLEYQLLRDLDVQEFGSEDDSD